MKSCGEPSTAGAEYRLSLGHQPANLGHPPANLLGQPPANLGHPSANLDHQPTNVGQIPTLATTNVGHLTALPNIGLTQTLNSLQPWTQPNIGLNPTLDSLQRWTHCPMAQSVALCNLGHPPANLGHLPTLAIHRPTLATQLPTLATHQHWPPTGQHWPQANVGDPLANLGHQRWPPNSQPWPPYPTLNSAQHWAHPNLGRTPTSDGSICCALLYLLSICNNLRLLKVDATTLLCSLASIVCREYYMGTNTSIPNKDSSRSEKVFH